MEHSSRGRRLSHRHLLSKLKTDLHEDRAEVDVLLLNMETNASIAETCTFTTISIRIVEAGNRDAFSNGAPGGGLAGTTEVGEAETGDDTTDCSLATVVSSSAYGAKPIRHRLRFRSRSQGESFRNCKCSKDFKTRTY